MDSCGPAHSPSSCATESGTTTTLPTALRSLKLRQRRAHLREPVQAVDLRFQLATTHLGDELDQVLALPSVRAQDVELARPDIAQVGLGQEPRARPAGDQAPSPSQRLDGPGPGVGPEVVDDDVRTAAGGQLPDLSREVFFCRVDELRLPAELCEARGLAAELEQAIILAPAALPSCMQARPTPPAAPSTATVSPPRHPCPAEQQAPCRAVGDGQGRVKERRSAPPRARTAFAAGTTAYSARPPGMLSPSMPRSTIGSTSTSAPRRGRAHALAQGVDDADDVCPRDVGQLNMQARHAAANEQVEHVESAGEHAHTHPTRPGLGDLGLGVLEALGPAVGHDDAGPHPAHSAASAPARCAWPSTDSAWARMERALRSTLPVPLSGRASTNSITRG